MDSRASIQEGLGWLKRLLAYRSWQFVVLLAVTVVIYGHTLDVPFYLDDIHSVRDNPAVQNGLEDPGRLLGYARTRFVGYLSFAIDHALHGTAVGGYHVTNIAIHFAAAITLWLLTNGLLRSPAMRERRFPGIQWLPLLVAMLFVVHPLQTQAVTYVVQRLASLTALFYLLSLVGYVRARLSVSRRRVVLWGGVSLVAGIAAILTKQNAATLPVALLLVEWLFFQPTRKRLFGVVGVGLSLLLGVWVMSALSLGLDPFDLGAIQPLIRAGDIPRSDYFVTQLPQLWRYLGQLVWPHPLLLDHDVRLITDFTRPVVIAAALGHVVVLVTAYHVRRRSPLVAFGVFFYYLAHAVESSLVPIQDLAFEHRTYLPNAGMFLVAGWLLLIAPLPRVARLVTVAGLVILMASLAWQRNDEWRDPERFWRANAELAPDLARPLAMLGEIYLRKGRLDDGLMLLAGSFTKFDSDGRARPVVRPAAAVNYAVGLFRARRYDELLSFVDEVDRPFIRPASRRATLVGLKGTVLLLNNDLPGAERAFRRALDLAPDFLPAKVNLAKTVALSGRMEEFEALYGEIRRVHPEAKRDLASLDRTREAVRLRAGE